MPIPVQIVSKKEIKSVNSVRLNDILNEQTGLVTVSDYGGGEGIQLQGLDSQYTLILIDGMPIVGRLAGTLDLSRVTVGNIKQIEIVKGASSSLYGNEALAGVINIITDSPKNTFNGDVNCQIGTFNAHDVSATINHKEGVLGISAFLNRYSNDGYDLDTSDNIKTVDPYINYTFTTKVKYGLNENTDIMLSSRFYNQHQEYMLPERLKIIGEINEWNSSISFKHKFSKKLSGFVDFYTTQYSTKKISKNQEENVVNQANFNQLFMRPELRFLYKSSKDNEFIGGVGLTHEKLYRTSFLGVPKFNSPYAFAQYDGVFFDRWNVTLGARFDNHSEYTSQFSPKLAFRYKVSNKIAVKSSVGFGFKTPDFRQLYFDFTNSSVGYTVLGYNAVSIQIPKMFAENQLINLIVPFENFSKKLNSESSINYNLGVDFNFSKFKLGINAFRNNIKNLIDTQVIARKKNGQNVFSYYNINKIYTQGLEINSTLKLTRNFKFLGGYQLLYAIDKKVEQNFKEGNVFVRPTPTSPSVRIKNEDYFGLFNRSRHMANAKFFYTNFTSNFNANLRGTYRSKYGLYDTNGNDYLDSYDNFVSDYTIWDFAINKTFLKKYTTGFGVDNIFDFKNPKYISHIAGRTFYITINIKF